MLGANLHENLLKKSQQIQTPYDKKSVSLSYCSLDI